MRTVKVLFAGAAVIILALSLSAADSLYPQGMATHVVAPVTIPASPTDVYTKTVWLVSVEFIPQSSTSPTCTVQDKSGTPIIIYNVIALTPNHSYRDSRPDTAPFKMTGGLTWSCSDTTVKGQLIVKY